MSRCFPFPPPGYEKKSRTESIDLLTKEKHIEKKHKKETRDKEKREHKEKKDKDRSKDKHKEKKDRKDTHKDRKKDKEKGRISEDGRTEHRIDGHNELPIQESLPKAEEEKDSKFTEELGRRTRDVGVANRMVGGFSNSSIQRNIEGMGAAATTLPKERFADKRMFSIEICSQKRNGVSDTPIENVSSSLSRSWTSSTATSMEKERGKTHEKVVLCSGITQTESHGISYPMEGAFEMVSRKSAGSTAEMEKGKFGKKDVVSNPFRPGIINKGKIGSTFDSSCFPTQRRDEIFGLSVENVSSICGKTRGIVSWTEEMGTLSATEKRRAAGCENFPLPCASEQRKNSAIGQPVEKDGYQKVERKVEGEDKKPNDSTGHKVGDHNKNKTKAKDNDGHHKGKKKEVKIVKKAEDVGHNKLKNFVQKNVVDNLNSKPLAPRIDNKPGIFPVDGAAKKRKDIEINGFLHENDARLNKSPRINSSSQSQLNGRKLELNLAPPSKLSSSNLKPDTILENKDNKVNGTAMSLPLSVEVVKPPAAGVLKNGEISSKVSHLDTKYLSKICVVPKMEEWPEFDEQDWLFNCSASWQKPKTLPETEDVPQVWAQAMRIDSADVFALPYVIPF